MLKSFFKALVFVAGLAWAGMAGAVGFGSATVASALGQPLKVEIALLEVSESDRSSISVRLASPEAFKAAGLEYPYHLSRVKFEVRNRNGQTFIEVTSKEPVNEPTINLFVELTWRSGKLLREYTFLLDPPEYQGQQPEPEKVAPIEPTVAVSPPPEPPEVQPLTPPASAPAETPVTEAASAPAAPAGPTAVQAESAPAPAPAPTEIKAAPETVAPVPETTPPAAHARPSAAAETITVRRGDTLSKLAAQIKEPDVTLEQMLVALYRANVNKFDGKNMNRIRAGKILTVPGPDAYEHLSNKEAAKIVHAQTVSWNAYKETLAMHVAPAPEAASKQEAAGKVTAAVTEKAPAAKGAPEKLVLSHGEAPVGQPGAGAKPQTPEAKAQAAKEDQIAAEKAAQDEKARAAMLAKTNEELNKAIALKGSAAAAASVPAAASAARPASGVPVRPKIGMPAPAPAPEPSILDDILGAVSPALDYLKDPVYLGAGAGGLVVLGALIYLLRRRGQGGGRTKKKK